MHEPIEFVSKVQLFGIISTHIYDRHISDIVRHSYCRTNDVLFDISSISCGSRNTIYRWTIDCMVLLQNMHIRWRNIVSTLLFVKW